MGPNLNALRALSHWQRSFFRSLRAGGCPYPSAVFKGELIALPGLPHPDWPVGADNDNSRHA